MAVIGVYAAEGDILWLQSCCDELETVASREVDMPFLFVTGSFLRMHGRVLACYLRHVETCCGERVVDLLAYLEVL